jgi:enterochelin esterase-like enzyme
MQSQHYQLYSRYFQEERDITVLLPPDYAGTRRRFPVLYLHDGSSDWTHRGRIHGVLQKLYDEDGLQMLVVMPEPRERTREYKLSSAHVHHMIHEVVPWVDESLRARAGPRNRAVHGVSLGGLMSVWLGYKYPSVFGAAGGQGGAYWYWQQRLMRHVSRDGAVRTRFFLACGDKDGNVEDNRALVHAMEEAGMHCRYEEVPGKHSWTCWRRTLPDALRYYFKP